MVEQLLQVAGNLLNELIGHQFIQFILMLIFGPHPKNSELGMQCSQQFLWVQVQVPLRLMVPKSKLSYLDF